MKIRRLVVLFVALISGVIGYVLASPLEFGFCQGTYVFNGRIGCLDKFLPMVGLVFILFSLSLLSLSIITFFLRDEIFRAWLKFAYWWLPISIFFIFLSANAGGGGGFGLGNSEFSPEVISMVFSGLFAFISILIILAKLVFPRSNKEKKEKLPPKTD